MVLLFNTLSTEQPGPALTAWWFQVLPFTASCLTTARVQFPAWACEEVTSDLGLGGGFHWVLWFTPPLRNGLSHDLA